VSTAADKKIQQDRRQHTCTHFLNFNLFYLNIKQLVRLCGDSPENPNKNYQTHSHPHCNSIRVARYSKGESRLAAARAVYFSISISERQTGQWGFLLLRPSSCAHLLVRPFSSCLFAPNSYTYKHGGEQKAPGGSEGGKERGGGGRRETVDRRCRKMLELKEKGLRD